MESNNQNMDKKKIITNVFSNWTNFLILIAIAFIVSPILVHNLGNEYYGIWTLIISITGFFTVLDFGVNTAVVRFISKYVSQNNTKKANELYNTAFLFFLVISLIVILFTAIFAAFFKEIFHIESLTNSYIYIVFFIVGIDLAIGLLFSVLLGTLTGLQEFLKINVISIFTVITKNVILVIMLLLGYKLLTLAIVQLLANILKYSLQYLIIRRDYGFLKLDFSSCNKATLKTIYNYSIFSFLIALATKFLFYTDSIVIGSLLNVSEITFYAIPATIVDYLEKLVWAMIAVLIPIISVQDAIGNQEQNKDLYVIGTKYSFIVSIPIIIVLFTAGDDFITIWMGAEYSDRSSRVLQILLVGYVFALSQLIAHAILKGISKHQTLAYILILEAALNLVISISLASKYGINGVAVGTTVPLLLANIFLIPIYTCRELGLNFFYYIWKSHIGPLIAVIILASTLHILDLSVTNYFQLILFSTVILIITMSYSYLFIIESHHKIWLINKASKFLLN